MRHAHIVMNMILKALITALLVYLLLPLYLVHTINGSAYYSRKYVKMTKKTVFSPANSVR
jgi:hypothetical protein